jgi:tRNA nucleotidyltransferase (CCA-adding enzyme)
MEIITTHKNTDFDGLASVIAATLIYPDAVPILPKSINPNIKAFLSIHKDLFPLKSAKEISMDEVTQLIVVDTNSWRRLEGMDALKKKGVDAVIWDHHLGGDIDARWKCQEEIGAAVTLLIRRLKETRKLLTPMQATLFLAGLYEDTGSLSFPSTTTEDVYAAAYLLERKADLKILGTFLRPAYGPAQKDVLFDMLQGATRRQVNGFSVSCQTINIDGHVGNLSLVVNMYREILNVDAAFGVFRDPEKNRCVIIGRSRTEELNVGSIMRSMGGGGHSGAGSAMIKTDRPQAIIERIVELIRGNQQSSVRVSDLMSYPVASVLPETSIEQTRSVIKEKGYTGLPVIDGSGVLVGIISRRDIDKVRRNQLRAPVKAIMSRDPITITPDRSPLEAARTMVKHDAGRLPVIDNGAIIGIVSRSDVMTYFYDLLPD